MKRKNPDLPDAVPYSPNDHPIGIYRLRVAWQNAPDDHFWQPIRIHAGAKVADLRLNKSAGCVRMRDPDAVHLVESIDHYQRYYGGTVTVIFIMQSAMYKTQELSW